MWSLYRDVAVTADEDAAVALAARLRLAEGSNYL
jgi:hypothetical protein